MDTAWVSQHVSSRPAGRQQAQGSARLLAAPIVSAVAVVVALVGFVPLAPAAWHGLWHLSTIGDHGARAGKLTVFRCVRGPLVLDWQCSGSWSVNDLEAQRQPPVAHMSLMNDTRYHAAGSRVDALYLPGKPSDGYLWGRYMQGITVVFWVGAAFCLLALALAVSGWRRRRRRLVWGAGISLILSALALLIVRTAM